MEEFPQVLLVLPLISVVFITIGVILNKRNKWLFKNGVPASGIVIELVKSYSSSSSGSFSSAYYPVVVFKTKNGRDIKKRMLFGTSPPAYSKGDKVNVLYAPDKPSKCMISSDKTALRVPKIFILVGGILTITTILTFCGIFLL